MTDTPYEVVQFPTYVSIEIGDTFNVKRDIEAYTQLVIKILDALPEPRFLLVQVGSVAWSIDDLITAASYSARGGSAYLHHQNVRELVVVSASKTVELAARGLSNPIFGGIKVKVFSTYNEALEYIK